MARRGFLTIAFDPSFTGESGGQPRYMASPDINTEDFQAAVDFLSVQEEADPDKIGIIGICGWGGMALNTAALDTRVKATVASTMYDMSRVGAKGYFDANDSEAERHAQRAALNAQRTADYKSGVYARAGGVVDPLPDDAPFFVKDYYAYYKTPRGYHPRSLNSNQGWNVTGTMSFLNQPILQYSNEIRSAVLLIHGDKAHSCYLSRDAFANMVKGNAYTANKELYLIPGAVHTDLYDPHTGKFGAESVRAALRRVRGSAPNFVPRGIPGGKNFCPAYAGRNGFPLERGALRYADGTGPAGLPRLHSRRCQVMVHSASPVLSSTPASQTAKPSRS